MQQFRDGVMLRMCCGLTLATLFVRFFDRYYVATIPKSRVEFLDSLFFLYIGFGIVSTMIQLGMDCVSATQL